MAHFAKVVDGIVENVIVAEQEFVDTQEGTWVQTSYNTREGVHLGQDLEPDAAWLYAKTTLVLGLHTTQCVTHLFLPSPFLAGYWMKTLAAGILLYLIQRMNQAIVFTSGMKKTVNG